MAERAGLEAQPAWLLRGQIPGLRRGRIDRLTEKPKGNRPPPGPLPPVRLEGGLRLGGSPAGDAPSDRPRRVPLGKAGRPKCEALRAAPQARWAEGGAWLGHRSWQREASYQRPPCWRAAPSNGRRALWPADLPAAPAEAEEGGTAGAASTRLGRRRRRRRFSAPGEPLRGQVRSPFPPPPRAAGKEGRQESERLFRSPQPLLVGLWGGGVGWRGLDAPLPTRVFFPP